MYACEDLQGVNNKERSKDEQINNVILDKHEAYDSLIKEFRRDKFCNQTIKAIINDNNLDINYRIPDDKDHSKQFNYNKYSGRTAFHYACVSKGINLELIKFLVQDCRAELNLSDDYNVTPFHFICLNKNVQPELIEFLIESGAEIKTTTSKGSLDFAMSCKNLPLMIFLYARGAKCSDWWDTDSKLQKTYCKITNVNEEEFGKLFNKLKDSKNLNPSYQEIKNLLPQTLFAPKKTHLNTLYQNNEIVNPNSKFY